jgi:Amt family ammonium transporter
MLGAATGAVAGLVAITPASGFVGPVSSIWIGAGVSVICYAAILLKNKLGYDDSLDAFGVHGVGGTWGAIATGLFASKAVNSAGADGLFFGNAGLLVPQIIAVVVSWVVAFVGTFVLVKLIDGAMGMRLTADEEREGLDLTQHDERGYIL